MASPESPSERLLTSETPIDQIIERFSKLKDELLTPEFLAELKNKTPKEMNKYKVDIREDFTELNMYFSSIAPENENEKNKIVSTMAPIFDALDNPANRTDPVMASFLHQLLPARSFIQDYYNGER